MLRVNQLAGFGARRSPYLLDILNELNLLANFNVVLDAADPRSYDGISQTWTDATGQGNNFFRGTTSGSDATDPTFNGVVGVEDESPYFSLDGGDYFTETAAHTFADNWHKDNGAFTIIAATYLNGATQRYLFSNRGLNGVSFYIDASDKLVMIHTTSGAGDETLTSTAAVSDATWNFCAVGYQESAPSCAFQINSASETPSASTSTAVGSNSQPLRIAAHGDAALPMLSGERYGLLALASSHIGANAMTEIYTRLKARRYRSFP